GLGLEVKGCPPFLQGIPQGTFPRHRGFQALEEGLEPGFQGPLVLFHLPLQLDGPFLQELP
ncbi:hypothetical protein ABTM82_20310, partial [Acinetobacter baumannii]